MIRLFKPYVGNEELENIKGAFERQWLGLGPLVKEFEDNWTKKFRTADSVGLNSCTAALHLSLNAYKFKEGSEVLVPAMTFVSSAHAILYNNLKPVFVDINPNTLCICINDLQKKITKNSVAILPVHMGGHPCNMIEIMKIAKENNLKVIEDCAHNAGGKYNNEFIGTIGDIGCYSFEEKKNMTTGDGGMISSHDGDLIKEIKKIRWCGIDRDTWKRVKYQDPSDHNPMHWYYEVPKLGYKYNMNDLAAAIGLAQLEKLDFMNKNRALSIQKYIDGFNGIDGLRVGIPYDLVDSSYWLFLVRVKQRDDFINHMKAAGISTGVHFMPLPLHPLYEDFNIEIPNSMKVWEELVTLPLYVGMSDQDINKVIETARSFFL